MIVAGDAESALQLAPELPVSIKDRLVALAQQPQRMLDRVEVSRWFQERAKPSLTLPRNVILNPGSPRGSAVRARSYENAYANETLVILNLAKSLPNNTDLEPGLRAVQEATAEPSELLDDRLMASRFVGQTGILLDWPALQISLVDHPRGRLSGDEVLKLQNLMPPGDLMHYAIHAAVSEILNSRSEVDRPEAQP